MLLILDTSVIISNLLSSGKNYTRDIIMLARAKKLSLAISVETLEELKQTIHSDNIKRLPHYSSQIVGLFIAWYQYNATFFSLDKIPQIELNRDKNDNIYLRLIKASNADCLITVDNDLLVLKEFNNIPILTPEQFIQRYPLQK
jgi:putative PIN family toxin of toxin-antitoxin system